MMQTQLDQFYKITNKSRIGKLENVKNQKKEVPIKLEIFPTPKSKKTSVPRISKRKRIAQKRNTSTNTGTPSKSRINMRDSPLKTVEIKTAISSALEQTSPTTSRSISPILGRSSRFTPKTASPVKEALDKSPANVKVRKQLFTDETEKTMFIAIDNLNLAIEGAIANNDINLEKVYASNTFNYKYNQIDTTTSTKYEISEIIKPTEVYSRFFSTIIANVFSKPFNCGYFDKEELDLIFSLLTLTGNAQALMIRMLKRKHTWHRINTIKYNQISTNLEPIFNELVSKSIFTNNIENEDIAVSLNLLQVDEIKKLCQQFKIKVCGKKEDYIQSVLKFYANTKPLFPGMPSPAIKLRASINRTLGYCILINTKVSQIVNKIITLFIPNQDPQETMADLFQILWKVEMKEIKFPEVTVSEFPIFANKEHLLNYMEAKSALRDVLNATEKKQWELVRQIGSQAEERLLHLLKVEKQSLEDTTLPSHIRHFMPGYTWLKVLYKSVDAFKKAKETIPQAVQFLHMLIEQGCHMKHRKGKWYNELIKIQVYHMKDPNGSVNLLSKAVSQENLTEVDRWDLLERAESLAKRKSNISQYAKNVVNLILENKLSKVRLMFEISSITIEGTLCGNPLQRKSNWCIKNDGADKMYGTVEELALYDYSKRGYIKGVHCEGAFPITLFGALFWEEIYSANIPGVCISSCEPTPLDLFSSEFYENRKEQIDTKLQVISQLDIETLSNHIKHKYELCCEYTSICQSNIIGSSDNLQEVAFCLGAEGIAGICKRLINNFTLWRAGFPDLIVWNPHTRQYKIVEVKGPGDTLSTKQKLWLQYLNQLGLNTEVCYCESDSKGGRKRKHETVI